MSRRSATPPPRSPPACPARDSVDAASSAGAMLGRSWWRRPLASSVSRLRSQRRRRLSERLKRATGLHGGDDTKASTVLTQRRQTVLFAAPTHCRGSERNQHQPHPRSCAQHWETAARVESSAQTISRRARSPDSGVDRRAGGSACGADCTCAHRARGRRLDPRDRRSSRSIASAGARVAQRDDRAAPGGRVDGGRFHMRLKLLVADDHPLVVAAVRMSLSDASDIEIVGEATAGQEVLTLVGRTSPDVVLLDLRMPCMDGLRLLELLRERYPSVKAIIFSGSDDPAAADAAFARGAVAFIQKTIDPSDLAAVIRQALAGNVLFASGNGGPPAPVESPWDLTPREVEVLRALAGGQSNKQMAREFWLSEQTIKYHLTNIYRKLGVSSRTEAVRQAYENRVIENPVLRTEAITA